MCVRWDACRDWTRRFYAARGGTRGRGKGVLQSVVWVDPVCMLARACEGRTGENPGCSKMEPLELDDAGKMRKDGIRGRESR